ncbi:MAG TPA: S41 family peptidase, partial [Armatimonadota bacterium]|nr:S41 family peptidase [Armatimonadota bacterium]
YSRNGFFHWSRPRYSGSGASQLWLLEVQNGTRQQITSNPFQHLWPHFTPDGKAIIHVTVGEKTPSAVNLNARGSKYVDTPLMTPNLWMHRLDGKSKQLTFFTGGSVRFPTVAAKTGDIVFEYETDLWMLKAGSTKPEKITLFASEDETQNSRRHEILKSGVTEAEPSPDGKYFAFGIRGDIWSILIDKPKGVAAKQAEIAKRLTDWAGDDSDFIWSKDGKHLYFTSDRQFNTRLYELDVETLDVKSLWDRPEDVSKLRLSPDGKELAFWVTGPEGGLYSLSVENGGYQRLVRLPGIHTYWHGGGDFAWSPDMQWIAYTFGEENGAWNVWIKPTAGGEAVNVTRLNAYHSQPVWSPDGKYLFFQSDRDGNGLYVIPLTVEPARTLETDIKFEKPKDPVEVVIDFDDISRRVRKLSSQAPQSDLTITSEGKILLISGGDIWSISYDGKDSKRLTSGGNCSALRASADGKKGYLIRNGELWTIGIEDSKLEKVEFTADWERDIRAERKAAFTQLWRSYNRLFYDANMHGRDWEAIRTRYEPLLDAVETREEFATLLGMMVGELEASHAEVGPAGGGNPSPVTPHLGFTFDYSYEGPGIKVDKVPPKAPGSYAQTEIKPGEYVVAIDGQDVTLDENLFKLINNKQNRMMTFLVNSKPTREDARTVQYTSLTWGEWTSLLYRNRIERLRKYVDDISDGKIGYVHISGMGEANQQQFDREFYEYSLDKKAMIIDVRFNGGGYISDGL